MMIKFSYRFLITKKLKWLIYIYNDKCYTFIRKKGKIGVKNDKTDK